MGESEKSYKSSMIGFNLLDRTATREWAWPERLMLLASNAGMVQASASVLAFGWEVLWQARFSMC